MRPIIVIGVLGFHVEHIGLTLGPDQVCGLPRCTLPALGIVAVLDLFDGLRGGPSPVLVLLDPLYLAAVESVEEAVVNALVAAKTTTTVKPAGRLCHAIDHDQLRTVMRRYGRLRQ